MSGATHDRGLPGIVRPDHERPSRRLGRAAAVFDRVVVAVLGNPRKQPLLDGGRPGRHRPGRARWASGRRSRDRIDVATFDGLTVDFCRAQGARSIVRGLRAISDFETEIQLAHNNRMLAPEVDTVFFMTSLEHGYVSSSLVKEIATVRRRRVGDGPGRRAAALGTRSSGATLRPEDHVEPPACATPYGGPSRPCHNRRNGSGERARRAVPSTSSSSSSGSSRSSRTARSCR